MTTRVLWCLRRRPRFSWLRRDYSDNDLRGVFFDRVFCVTRYGRSLDWLRVKSKDRLLFGRLAWAMLYRLKSSLVVVPELLLLGRTRAWVACTSAVVPPTAKSGIHYQVYEGGYQHTNYFSESRS